MSDHPPQPPPPPPPPPPRDPRSTRDQHDSPTSAADPRSELSPAELAALSAHASRGAPIEQPGARIGPYHLLSVLGEGGFGVVWLAEQAEPVRRRVALKIIKPGMDSRDILARFEQERQALALMDHPSIAKVFDGGVTAPDMGSRPYFVMELVHGDPITAFCDRERLDLPRRLDLFIRVCDAVQHAHHKGIVHRDLKPSNILVEFQDGQPSPRIIDFGVAKALHRPLTERTLFTEHGRLIGTPEYMSPEQAELTPVDIDTRSDIYSLGVLLYELLTGTLPFDPRTLRAAGIGEIQRIIRDVTPPRPSTRLSTISASGTTDDPLAPTVPRSPAQRPAPPSLEKSVSSAYSLDAIARARQTDARTLSRHLRRDLDWVVMKCLEKERNRRYATANALGADLRRFLDNQPVSAGPPSVWYRSSKFVRRHRLPVAAAAAIALALVAATIVSLVSADAARRARIEAERSEQETTEVSFFLYDMITRVRPGPLGLDMLDALRQQHRRAIESASPPPSPEQMAADIAAFDAAMIRINKADAARTVIDQSILARAAEAAEGKFAEQPIVRARLQHTLSNAWANLGLYDKAREFMVKALDTRRQVLGPRARPTLISIAALAQLEYHARRDFDAAIRLATEALDGRRATLGPAHSDTIASITILATLELARGRVDDARRLLEQALADGRRHLGDDDKVTIEPMIILGDLARGRADLDAAARLIDEAAERATRTLGLDHDLTLKALNVRAQILAARNDPAQAERILRQVHETHARTLGWNDTRTQDSAHALVRHLLAVGKPADAEPIAARLVELRAALMGPDHWRTLALRLLAAEVQAALGRAGPQADTVSATIALARAQARATPPRFPDAERLLTELAARPGLTDPQSAAAAAALVDLYEGWDRADPGKGHADKAARWRPK